MEETLRNTKEVKTKSFESPKLDDKIAVVLDNRTTIYFAPGTSLEKMALKIARYKSHLSKVSILIEEPKELIIKDKKSIIS